jgi:hypothetical protein
MKMERSEEEFHALLENGAAEVAYNRALRGNIEFYGALDEFVSVKTDRRNEGAKWSFWYREFVEDNTPPRKEIEAQVTVSRRTRLALMRRLSALLLGRLRQPKISPHPLLTVLPRTLPGGQRDQ